MQATTITDFSKIKESFTKFLKNTQRSHLIIVLGIIGLALMFFSKISKKAIRESSISTNSHTMIQSKQEKLQQNLENIISSVEGAGKSKVLITFENDVETVYATEEKKNKEASEDKSGGEITRKKESDDCEKKYITIKDGHGTEHPLPVTELEPKARGAIIICSGADDPIVKQRITNAVTTALNIPSNKVCITKSV